MGRRLLLKRINPLLSTFWKSRAHAVLAFLSKRYSTLQGRSPTRYSPVRHWASIATNSVRLACIRHTANVHPEPGSNSPLKFITLRCFHFTEKIINEACSNYLPISYLSCIFPITFQLLRFWLSRDRILTDSFSAVKPFFQTKAPALILCRQLATRSYLDPSYSVFKHHASGAISECSTLEQLV